MSASTSRSMSSDNEASSAEQRQLLKLEELQFDNSALRELPLDPIEENYVRRNNSGVVFSRVKPTPVLNPKVVAYSPEALMLLGLDPKEAERPEFAEYFSGNKLLPGADPAAHCYCGHQFGNFAGQLGDGRAMYMGELINDKGERWELQFKGAGKTPYSRDADGRAVLRSSIREFLCSEAMFHLGIPTTRAGTLVTSDTYVIRDIHYDGHPIREKATILSRIAPTFIRFGSFQICSPVDPTTGRQGPSVGKYNILKNLVDYTIKYHYPHIWNDDGLDTEHKYAAFYGEVVVRTARLVAEWMCVGWGHGVLNTDNMSIIGVTIDYGPFGFVDWYDPGFICNGSDNTGRYSLQNQPEVCKWNLARLRDALTPLVPRSLTQPMLDKYDQEYEQHYYSKMHKKLGLFKDLEGDKELILSLLDTMNKTGADFTNTFRSLSRVKLEKHEPHEPPTPNDTERVVTRQEEEQLEKEHKDDSVVHHILTQTCSHKMLVSKVTPRIPPRELQMMMSLAQQNPGLLQMFGASVEFLMEEIKRIERYEEIKNMTEKDKSEQDHALWHKWMQRYKERLEKELDGIEHPEAIRRLNEDRTTMMNSNNPKFILRNYLVQTAIAKAEKGDFSEVYRLFELLKDPYGEGEQFAEYNYDAPPPDWAAELCVT